MANEETAKTDEQIAKERDAVERMKGAKSAMELALSRIGTLESALTTARSRIATFKGYVSPGVYTWGGNSKTCHSEMDDAIALITKALGA